MKKTNAKTLNLDFKNQFKLKNYINYIIILAVLVVMIILNEVGLLKRGTLGLLTQISYSIVLAVSLNLVVGFLGELSLGHAGFMCAGAYIGCLVSTLIGDAVPDFLRLIIAMIVGGSVASVFGFLIGLPALRLKGDYLAIITLAFGEIVRSVARNIKGLGGAQGFSLPRYGNNLFIVGFILALITIFVMQNLVKSKHGRAITAIRDNEIAAKAMGVNVTSYKLQVFTISAFFAGAAGVIYGHNSALVASQSFSYNYSIEILVMVVLGGMGSITGSIISASLLTYINVKLTTLGGDLAAAKYLIYAIVLITMMIFNAAPKLAPIREKLKIQTLFAFIKKKINSKAKAIEESEKVDEEEAE